MIKHQILYQKKTVLNFILYLFLISYCNAQTLKIDTKEKGYQVDFLIDNKSYIKSPPEGLWSIASNWENEWPSNWIHVKPESFKQYGDWHILRGKMSFPEGDWYLQDAYKQESGKIKCIRRYEWKGNKTLDSITLAIRWKVSANNTRAFLPGILYYGNPSGESNLYKGDKTGPRKVPVYNGNNGEKAIFEEHRFPLPFASLEWENNNNHYGAALHSIPSPVPGGKQNDQWWSLGVEAYKKDSEIVLFSGPIAYNNTLSSAKAMQNGDMKYTNTFIKVKPGTVIEKTFYLEAYQFKNEGSGFQQPLYTSIEIFKPFYSEDLPTVDDILDAKFRFTKSRYMENEHYAGFNMFPSQNPFTSKRDKIIPQIVLGWAGQSEAPAYALQILSSSFKDNKLLEMVQKSLDHITTSPFDQNGFKVIYNTKERKWHGTDPVSQGQAMNSIALAIKAGRKNKEIITSKWELFLKKASDIHSNRILMQNWNPINTSEAFYISPLLMAKELFNEEKYERAALKITDYYGQRHIDMKEPYWGGTLDANCEDKEGAWGAFQGFLAAYENTGNKKYLNWAKHAGDVTLSYTVVWDIPLPAGRLANHNFKTRGWTVVSPQNQHLDVYGVLITPSIYKLGTYIGNESLKRLAKVMYRSCGQMIDPFGSQGEQMTQTNFAQHGDISDINNLRGGYSEDWTVYWITAHFLHAAAQFQEMGVNLESN